MANGYHLTSKLEDGWPESIFHDTQPEWDFFQLCISLSTFPVHASMPFTLYLPYACLYEFHCALSLRMPLCISLSTFPAHASMHFTVYFSCACICALPSALALCMPLCMSLSTFPAHASIHFTVYFPCACLYAFHCHASMHFTLYLPYACLYATHCALSLRAPLCISLSTFPMQLSCAERNDFAGRTLRNAFGQHKFSCNWAKLKSNVGMDKGNHGKQRI